MKQGRTLQEVAAELARQRTNKRDFAVDSVSVRMDEDGGGITLLGGSNSEQFGMTELFHRQLGSALGIPAKYYDKLRAELPSLLAENVNGWLENRADRQLIRTMDGRARAFLSDRYRRIDNYEIAEATLPLLSELEDVTVESCEVTENFMYIKAVNPRLQTEIVPGDIVQAGVMISNSEVGLGSVKVMPLVYRLVCKNGFVANDLGERKYHIGREQDGDWELFTDETLRADDAAFMLKLRDIVRSAVDEARFHSVADRLREAANVKISGCAPKVVELTATNFGFIKPESDGILNHLITGGDLSMYGLSNAVTRASQDVESYDRATALESAGWRSSRWPRAVVRAERKGVSV